MPASDMYMMFVVALCAPGEVRRTKTALDRMRIAISPLRAKSSLGAILKPV